MMNNKNTNNTNIISHLCISGVIIKGFLVILFWGNAEKESQVGNVNANIGATLKSFHCIYFLTYLFWKFHFKAQLMRFFWTKYIRLKSLFCFLFFLHLYIFHLKCKFGLTQFDPISRSQFKRKVNIFLWFLTWTSDSDQSCIS